MKTAVMNYVSMAFDRPDALRPPRDAALSDSEVGFNGL